MKFEVARDRGRDGSGSNAIWLGQSRGVWKVLEPGRETGRVRGGGIYVRECKTNGRETILTRENIFVIT